MVYIIQVKIAVSLGVESSVCICFRQ